jgi:cytochrome c-type biogenesis protein CcmH/NrfG
MTQGAAAAELTELARRLEALQTPMLERLRAYEQRIGELEKDLADQSKENRELLKLKIEMLREKIETERTASRSVNFN